MLNGTIQAVLVNIYTSILTPTKTHWLPINVNLIESSHSWSVCVCTRTYFNSNLFVCFFVHAVGQPISRSFVSIDPSARQVFFYSVFFSVDRFWMSKKKLRFSKLLWLKLSFIFEKKEVPVQRKHLLSAVSCCWGYVRVLSRKNRHRRSNAE